MWKEEARSHVERHIFACFGMTQKKKNTNMNYYSGDFLITVMFKWNAKQCSQSVPTIIMQKNLLFTMQMKKDLKMELVALMFVIKRFATEIQIVMKNRLRLFFWARS